MLIVLLQMIKEKSRFLSAPTNFAVEKSRLMKAKVSLLLKLIGWI